MKVKDIEKTGIEIQSLIDLVDPEDENGLNKFIQDIKKLTNANKVLLAEDGVFEIDNLDFQDMENLQEYFSVQEMIETKYYKRLFRLVKECSTREVFCEKATDMTGTIVRQYGETVRLNNIDFPKKQDLLDYLEAYQVFEKYAEEVDDYEIDSNGRGILLEGVAYIHDLKQTMLDNTQHDIPIEGYLVNGKVKWDRIDKTAFTEKTTSQGPTYILSSFDEVGIKKLCYKRTEEIGFIEKPYPIAIIDKNKFIFMCVTRR